jgi:hypothetical protein
MGLDFLSTEKKREVEVIVGSTTMNLRSLARIVFHLGNPTRKMDMRKIFRWHEARAAKFPLRRFLPSIGANQNPLFKDSGLPLGVRNVGSRFLLAG